MRQIVHKMLHCERGGHPVFSLCIYVWSVSQGLKLANKIREKKRNVCSPWIPIVCEVKVYSIDDIFCFCFANLCIWGTLSKIYKISKNKIYQVNFNSFSVSAHYVAFILMNILHKLVYELCVKVWKWTSARCWRLESPACIYAICKLSKVNRTWYMGK